MVQLNQFPKILILLFSFTFPYSLFAQNISNGKLSVDTVVYPHIRIKTDVFILNTCDPLQVSLRRKNDDDSLSFIPQKKLRKLEVYANRLNSFKIEGINPLRYKYYINSEAVTQFTDVTAQVSQLSNFLKDGYFISPLDISVPQIFKEEIGKSNQRATLEPFEKNISSLKDSLSKYKAELGKIMDENPYPLIKFDVNRNPIPYTDEENKRIAESDKKTQPARLNFNKWENKLNEMLEAYERQIMTLPISSTNLSILKDYKTRHDTSFKANPLVSDIEISIREFAFEYDRVNNDFKKIDSFLNILKTYRYGNATNQENWEDSLASLLRKYGYTIPIDRYSIGQYGNTSAVDVKEFLIKKRYQVFEEFVLGTATKIGIMLQSSFRDISQKTNSLKMQNCLDMNEIEKLKIVKDQLSEVFDFVQKTSAEFQILVSYLDIDNKIYAEIAKSINTNYYLLLGYLKNMDLLAENNTIEFTLPSSTNLKNIDLVRYKIDREDKVTGAKQSYVYDFWVRGGLKVDFSFGIFASGLVDNEYQKHQYDSLGTLTDSVEVNKQDGGGYNFGFGGMVNITPRLGTSWITPGVSFGVIYSSNQKLQFVSNLALHVGKTERLILHGGIALGFVKTIDLSQHQWTTIHRNNIYRTKADVNQFSIPTIDKFMVRPVFGLTYNLSKKNALQAVSNSGLSKYRELESDPGTKTVIQ